MLVPRMFGENFMKIGALKGHQDSTCPPSVLLEDMDVPETLGDGVKRVEPSPGMFPASLKLIG